MRRIPTAGRIALLAILAAACRDNPASPVAEAAGPRADAAAAEPGGRVLEPPVYPAFDLELTASGSMQPGKPIRLHLKGAAKLAAPDVEITLIAPDFEAAKMSGFGTEFTLPAKGTRLPRLLERRTALSAGQGLNESVTLTVPAPGYYRVVASIGTEADLPHEVDGQRVVRNVYREIWLRVDKRGGRATKKFERTALPDVAAQRPGPLHCRVSDVEERRGKPRDPACDGATILMVEPIVCPYRVEPGELQTMALSTCTDPCATSPYLCGGDPCEIDPLSCYTPPPPPPLQPMAMPGSTPCGVGPFWAEYYNGVTPGSYTPSTRCESAVRHDWEGRSPMPAITPDHFSARWTGWQTLAAGTYTFTARASDGVRVWVDNELLIDAWRDQGETNLRATRELAAGTHRVMMEYYERTGDATAQLSWSGGPYGSSDACFNNTKRCFQYWYYDAGTHQYEMAPEGTLVKASYQDRDCAIACWWNEMYAVYHRLDAEGRVQLACPANSSSKRLRTHHEFLDDYVAVGFDEWLGPEVHGCDTGWDRVEIATNEEAFVYGNMRKAAQRAVSLFGRNSDRVRVDFDSNLSPANSWYDLPLHHISIEDASIWGNEGAETHAHEYGHSYHNRALGGIGHIYVSGWPTHSFNSSDTGDKALLEGFAEFFATLVIPGKGGTGFYVRHPELWRANQGSTLPTGVRTEGRVAAWMWDLVDDPNEKGTDHELPHWEPGVAAPYHWGTYGDGYVARETWDGSQVLPSMIAFLLETCRGLDGSKAESADGLYYCLRNVTPTTQHPTLAGVWTHDIETPMP